MQRHFADFGVGVDFYKNITTPWACQNCQTLPEKHEQFPTPHEFTSKHNLRQLIAPS
jgi:hypothetical protein